MLEESKIIAVQPTPSETTSSVPNLDPGLYSLLSTLIWIILGSVLLYMFRDVSRSLIAAMTDRLKGGAAIKIWHLELGPLRVSTTSLPKDMSITAEVNQSLESERNKIYIDNRRLFIVHRLFPSPIPGQLYDILLYVLPHESFSGNGNLNEVNQVDYYFGSAWEHNVFSSTDRAKRFAIVISAHGSGFLCFARIHLRNGSIFSTWRYIDFEAGSLGSDNQVDR